MKGLILFLTWTLVAQAAFPDKISSSNLKVEDVQAATMLLSQIPYDQISGTLANAFLGDNGYCDPQRGASGVSAADFSMLSKECQRLRSYKKVSEGFTQCLDRGAQSREKKMADEILCALSQTSTDKVPCQQPASNFTKNVNGLHGQTNEIVDDSSYDEVVNLSLENAIEVYWAMQKKFGKVYGEKTTDQMAAEACPDCEDAGKKIIKQRLTELKSKEAPFLPFASKSEILESLKSAMAQVNVAAKQVVANADSGILGAKAKLSQDQEQKYQNYIATYRDALNSPAGVLLSTNALKDKMGSLLTTTDKNNFEAEKMNGKIIDFRLKGHSIKILESPAQLDKAFTELTNTLKGELKALSFLAGGRRDYISGSTHAGLVKTPIAPTEKLKEFVVTSPIPVAQYLLAHPEIAAHFCELILSVANSEKYMKLTSKALLTGSVVVTAGGALAFGSGFFLGAGMAGAASIIGSLGIATGVAASSWHLYDSMDRYDTERRGYLSFLSGNAGEDHAVEIDQAYKDLKSAELQFVIDGVIAPVAGYALGKALETELARSKGMQLLSAIKEIKASLQIAKNTGTVPLAQLGARMDNLGLSLDKLLIRASSESPETQEKLYNLLKNEDENGLKKFVKMILEECKK